MYLGPYRAQPEELVPHAKRFFLLSLLTMCSLAIAASGSTAQVSVTSATPNNAAQGTVNLDVIVSGNGFKKGAKAHWFLTGTTNPGGVTVNSTTFNNSGQLTANITVATDALIGNFDIQVVNTDGRTGKGTELFAVKSNKTAACTVPAPLNIAPATTACNAASGQTCLDASFGNGSQLPPGGLVLTNTDGSVAAASDLDGADTVLQQQIADGTSRLVAIGNTTNPNVAGQSWDGVVRYNLDCTLDASYGTRGIAKFFPPVSGVL